MFDDNVDKKNEDDQLENSSINLLPTDLKKERPKPKKDEKVDFYVPKNHKPHSVETKKIPKSAKPEKPKTASKLSSFLKNIFKPKPKPKSPKSDKKPQNQNIFKKTAETADKKQPQPPRPKPDKDFKPNQVKKEQKSSSDAGSYTKFHEVKADSKKDEKEDSKPKKDDLEVNLLPYKKRYLALGQAIFFYTITAIAVLSITAFVYLFYKIKNIQYGNSNQALIEQINIIDEKIKNTKTEIESFGPLANKFQYVSGLLDSHIYWSRFLPTLESNTVPSIFYVDLAAENGSYNISLNGRALNLRAIAEQLVVLEGSEIYSNVLLDGVALPSGQASEKERQEGVSFSASFSLDPAVINATPPVEDKK